MRIHLLRTQIWNLGNRAPIEESIKATLNNIQRYRAEQTSTKTLRSRRESDETAEGGSANDLLLLPPSSHPGSRKADITMLLTDSGEVEFVEGVEHLAIPGSICTPRGTAVIRVGARVGEGQILLAPLPLPLF